MKRISENDYVLIVYKEKRYFKEVLPEKSFHGKGGIIEFGDLIGQPFGIRWLDYTIYKPTLEECIMYGISRDTQIIYPKDGAYVCHRLDVHRGSKVLEVGAGSGALTLIFSSAAGPEGQVVSFEREERHYATARKNLARFVPFRNVDIRCQEFTGLTEERFDCAFIDVREPWVVLDQVRISLQPGSPVGMIVPTANQISDTLKVMDEGWGEIEVLEILVRKYKTVAERVRPKDRMVAHTGYLIFARSLGKG